MKNWIKYLVAVLLFTITHSQPLQAIIHLNENSPKTVISGSYRKHLHELMRLKKYLQTHGVLVLSPVGEEAKNPEEEFISWMPIPSLINGFYKIPFSPKSGLSLEPIKDPNLASYCMLITEVFPTLDVQKIKEH